MPNGKVFGIVAIKGGVGKTTLTANIGSVLSNEFNKRVLIVDGNFSTPHLGLSLGLINPKISLQNVLSNEASVFHALHKHPSGFYIIPGALSSKKINPLLLKDKISELRDYFDIIFIDSSPSLNDEMLATIMASDELIVVTSQDYPTLHSTIHAVKIAKERKTPINGLVVNKSRNKKFELSIEDIEKATGVPVLSVLPDDVKVLESAANTTPTAIYSPKRKITKKYKKLGASLINENYVENPIAEKFKSKIGKTISSLKSSKKKISSMKNKLLKKLKKGGKNGKETIK